MRRLTPAALTGLTPDVVVPQYKRASSLARHAHIGVGVFHRAHQAIYADDLLNAGSLDDAIVGFSLRSAAVVDALAEQDLLYTVAEVDAGDLRTRIIGSLKELHVVPHDPAAAVDRLADPAIEIVTTTVTEGGYHLSKDGDALDFGDLDIVHDLEFPESPRTMPGLLVAALARRFAQGTPPFVVVPCDNLVGNGKVAHAVLVQLASEVSASLGRRLDNDVAFCSTMVDRMVPTSTPEMRQLICERTGVDDAWPVVTEPYRQWVSQDHPALRRWGDVGIELVRDTSQYEDLKLHVLNGLHSAIAYLGIRLGHSMISDAVADPVISGFVEDLLDKEILPSVDCPPGVDAAAYARQVLARFAEPGLGYTTSKVASDGALKLQQRLIPTVRKSIEDGRSVEFAALALASWGWCMFGPKAGTIAIEDVWLDDKLATERPVHDPQSFVDWLFGSGVLLDGLTATPGLRDTLVKQAGRIWAEPFDPDIFGSE